MTKYTPDGDHNDNRNIGPAFTLPPDIISVTPKAPGLPEFSYRRIEGQESLSLLIDDAHLGNWELALTLTQADYVSASFYAMLREIDQIRQRWAANNA